MNYRWGQSEATVPPAPIWAWSIQVPTTHELVQYGVLRQWSNKMRLKQLNPYECWICIKCTDAVTSLDHEVPWYVDPECKSISQCFPLAATSVSADTNPESMFNFLIVWKLSHICISSYQCSIDIVGDNIHAYGVDQPRYAQAAGQRRQHWQSFWVGVNGDPSNIKIDCSLWAKVVGEKGGREAIDHRSGFPSESGDWLGWSSFYVFHSLLCVFTSYK